MTTTRKTVDLYVTHMNNRPQSTITTLETWNAAVNWVNILMS